MLQKIDAWMIDKAEKFSHFTQRWVGITAPTWERLFLCLCIVDFLNVELARDWGKVWMITDVFMLFTWTLRFVLSFYKQSKSLGAEIVCKAEKCDESGWRPIGCLIAAVALPISIWRSLSPPLEPLHTQYWFAYWQISLIFAACDDLPLGPSKARKFLQFAIEALSWKAPEPVSDARLSATG